jgi:hypothetical protein
MTDVWNEIERIPAEMAAAVRPHLKATTLEGYQRFLEAMIHYTRGSGARLRHAAEHAPEGELRAFFADLARDEAGHYKLAEADLAAFGRAPAEATPADVEAFHSWWMSAGDPAVWLGALYVLESVGGQLAADATQNLGRLGLGREHVRFVMVHLEADVAHGAGAREHASALGGGDVMLASARRAADFWVELHRRSLGGGRLWTTPSAACSTRTRRPRGSTICGQPSSRAK